MVDVVALPSSHTLLLLFIHGQITLCLSVVPVQVEKTLRVPSVSWLQRKTVKALPCVFDEKRVEKMSIRYNTPVLWIKMLPLKPYMVD